MVGGLGIPPPHLGCLLLQEVEEIGIFWETTSGFIPIFSAIWFDSGYMSAVYVAGFAVDIAPGAVFLRGFQALMRCIMAGMDQQDSCAP